MLNKIETVKKAADLLRQYEVEENRSSSWSIEKSSEARNAYYDFITLHNLDAEVVSHVLRMENWLSHAHHYHGHPDYLADYPKSISMYANSMIETGHPEISSKLLQLVA